VQAQKDRERDQMYIRIANKEVDRLNQREENEKAKRLLMKTTVKGALED